MDGDYRRKRGEKMSSITKKTIKKHRKSLERVAFRFIVKNFFNPKIRNTLHFREWWRNPMNYVRQMELPLVMELLSVKKEDSVLDVSSPKLLALYYSIMGVKQVVASDRDDYFVNDFEQYSEQLSLKLRTEVFDVTQKTEFPNNYFDKMFSVSVIEHINGDGDQAAVKEMLRMLKPGGSLVLTVPAWNRHVEEWLNNKHFYWDAVKNSKGRYFYQRRYDKDSVIHRLGVDGAEIKDIYFIAEKPIREVCFKDGEMLLHNASFINQTFLALFARWGSRLKIPGIAYLLQRHFSKKCHYITKDPKDENIRQAVVLISKAAA
jgi:SAM-dependent methyltransferase